MDKTVPEPPNNLRQEPSRRGGVCAGSVNGPICLAEQEWQPRQESNLDQTFRKRLFYPLNYGAERQRNTSHLEAAEKSPASLGERGRGLELGVRPLGRGGQYWIRTSDLSRVRRTL